MLTVAKEKRSNILRFMIAQKCVGRSTRFRCPSSATNSISIRTFQCTFLAACELVRNSLIEKPSSIADQIPTHTQIPKEINKVVTRSKKKKKTFKRISIEHNREDHNLSKRKLRLRYGRKHSSIRTVHLWRHRVIQMSPGSALYRTGKRS